MSKRSETTAVFSLLALPAAVLYLEIVLRLTAGLPVSAPGLPGLIVTALAAGAFFSLICLLTGRAGGWTGFVLLELCTVWFLIAYFTDNAYQVFMDASSIFGEAKNVVKGFGGTLLTIVTKGFPVILLYHVPVILWLIFRKRLRFTGGRRLLCCLLLLIAAAGLGFSGYLLDTRTEALAARYTAEYTYDSAVRNFGVLTALELDLRHLNGSAQSAEEIVFTPAAPAAVQETAPAEPETPPEAVPEELPEAAQEELPEQVSEELPEAPPEPVEYGYNVMDIDFETLIANAPDNTVRGVHEYVSSLEPSRQNEFTGLFAGKNLILITAESFTAEVIDPVRTPTLYRLAHKGICFEDFYQPAWGGSTSTGEFSFLMGTIPATASAIQRTIGHNLYFTLGNQLQRQGYFSRAYHNGDLQYYNRHLTHKNLGYSEYIAIGNGLENGLSGVWPASDLEMLQYTLPDYIDQQPFSVYYMSVSGHCNYVFSNYVNSMAMKNQAVTEGMTCSDKVRAYYAANQELENALSYLVGQLEEKGIADDTVIALCTDHYPYGLEKSTAWGNDRDYLCELFGCDTINNLTRDHNAAILWSGCLEEREEPVTVSAPTYSLDMVPTLSNLFGLEYDSRLLAGRDVLSDTEPLVLWMDHSWLTDKGYYNSADNTFTPKEGVETEEGYVERIKQIVSNKMAFSKAVLNYDYYGLLFGADENN